MRFLVDENFPAAAVEILQLDGHDVCWIRTVSPGISDREVLGRAVREQRILLTFDKDFGELVFRLGQPNLSGIILFRVLKPSPEELAQMISKLIQSRETWSGIFAVIERDRIRIRKLFFR